MADFNFYLNKSGIRGPKGEKGDNGFSPSITEEVNTLDDYRLRIVNEFDSFVTDNLRGKDYFDATDPNGTYLRYNQETGRAYTGVIDQATSELTGGAKLATSADIDTFNENKIVTPALFADSLSKLIVNNDGNLSIVQDESSSKTNLNLSQKVVHPNLFYSTNSNYLQTGDIRFNGPINIIEGTLADTGRRGCIFELKYSPNHFIVSDNGLALSNAVVNTINNTKSSLDTEITTRLNADTQLQTAIDAERREREIQDAALQNQLGSKITVDNIKQGKNITLAKDGNNVTINASSLTVDNIKAGTNITIDKNGDDITINSDAEPLPDNIVYTDDDKVIEAHKKFARGLSISDGSNRDYALYIMANGTEYASISPSKYLTIGNRNGETYFEGTTMFYYFQPTMHKDNGNYKLLSQDTVEAGDNITVEQTTNGIKISSTGGGGGGAIIDDGDPATNKVYSSSKTSDLVGELGNEVNGIAGRLNTLEGEVVVATENNLGLVQPDGTTITIDSDGKISAIGSGDMTTDTAQTVTGDKTFIGNTLKIGTSDGASQRLATLRTDSISSKDGSSSLSRWIDFGTHTVGNFYRPYVSIGMTGVVVNYSNLVALEGVKSGDNISLVKDESRGTVTISADLSEVNDRIDKLELFKFPNATIEGDPTINNGQISNFSTTNYLRFPFEFKTEGRTWLLNGSFDTDSDVNTQQNIIDSLASVALAVRNGRLVLALSTNGTSFNLGEHESMSDIETNTKYYFRLSFSGTQYLLSISTNKQEWLPEIIVASDQPIASKPMTISSSGHPFKGTLNLNDWDLTVANTLVWQGMDDVGIASRMDVNASNITETGKQVIREIAGGGAGDIGEALDLLNGGDSTLLDTKLNKDLSNLTEDKKSYICGLSTPSNRFIDLELGASGGTYTAPANGWVTFSGTSSVSGFCQCALVNMSNQIGSNTACSTSLGYPLSVNIPVQKNDTFMAQYLNLNKTYFRFVYAEGSKEDN